MGRFSIRRRQRPKDPRETAPSRWGFAKNKDRKDKSKNQKTAINSAKVDPTDKTTRETRELNDQSQNERPTSSTASTKTPETGEDPSTCSQSDSLGSAERNDSFDRLVATLVKAPSTSPSNYPSNKTTIEIIQARLDKSKKSSPSSKTTLAALDAASTPSIGEHSDRTKVTKNGEDVSMTESKLQSIIRIEQNYVQERKSTKRVRVPKPVKPKALRASAGSNMRSLAKAEDNKSNEASNEEFADDDQSMLGHEDAPPEGFFDVLLDFVGGADEEEYEDEDSYETSHISVDQTQSMSMESPSCATKRGSGTCGHGAQGCGPTTWKQRMLCGAQENLEDNDDDASSFLLLQKNLTAMKQQDVFDMYFLEALWQEMRTMKASDITTACGPIPLQRITANAVVPSKETIIEQVGNAESEKDLHPKERDSEEGTQPSEAQVMENAKVEAADQRDSDNRDDDEGGDGYGAQASAQGQEDENPESAIENYPQDEASLIYSDPPLQVVTGDSFMTPTAVTKSKLGVAVDDGTISSALISPLTYRSSPSCENSILDASVREFRQEADGSTKDYSPKSGSQCEPFDEAEEEREPVEYFKTDTRSKGPKSALAKRAMAIYGERRAAKQNQMSSEVDVGDHKNVRSRGLAMVSNRKKSFKSSRLQ
mmetsp:Transcript_6461/g.13201  ORF Transcript_6461/g.13201 Transcript_6461/m.13201 type:complete len:653 (+) Transcript_6461:66-2024(+)